MKYLFSALLLLVSVHAEAAPNAAVHACGSLDSIANLVQNVKTYANGEIRVAYVTTEEPAAVPDHLLLFVYDNEMSYDCFAVSADKYGTGFNSIAFDEMLSSYDSRKGLLLSVPVFAYNHETGGSLPLGRVMMRVNREGGRASVQIER